jgi:hypothetical protein
MFPYRRSYEKLCSEKRDIERVVECREQMRGGGE